MPSVKGILILLLLFFSSLFGSVFLLGPLLPLMLVSVPWYRWITNRVVAVWFTLPVALLEMVLGVRVVITGDGFVPGERSVIIMNHRTRLDWMYLWNCLLRYSYLRMEKICLKSSLKSIPGFGWAMQVAAFIFVERRWERDRPHLRLMLEHLCSIRVPLQLLIFPEGTDLTATTKARSDVFAEAQGLPKYDYVLHPRTTGFAFIVHQLRQGSNVDAIHDVTVAYPYNIPQSERDLFAGQFPREIHFHVRRHPAAHLPVTLEGLQEWCRLRWRDKERMLHRFYQGDRSFRGLEPEPEQSPEQERSPERNPEQSPEPEQSREQSPEPEQSPEQGKGLELEQKQGKDRSPDRGPGPVEGPDRGQVQGPGSGEVPERSPDRGQSSRRRWGQPRGRERLWVEGRSHVWLGRGRRQRDGQAWGQTQGLVPPCKSRGRVFLIKLFSMVYWTGFVLGTFLLLWSSTLARWYFTSMIIFFILQERLFGGIEMLEMAAHRRSKNH